MTIEDDIAFLERVPLLRRLGGGALRILAIGAETLYRASRPSAVHRRASPPTAPIIVQRGSFSLKPERAGEAESSPDPGTLLGELALLAETKRPATATAREDSMVLRHLALDVSENARSYPDAAQRLRELIASRTDQWAREMENIRAALTRDKRPQ